MNRNDINPQRVLLAMSGGTDSSVSAMMLLEQGYEVIGVTFRFFEAGGDQTYLEDARAVAARLGIDHRVYDFREEFRQGIVQYFIDEYLRGRTPMPCAVCNRTMKFRVLKEIADELQIPYIATGHYVQLVEREGHRYVRQGNDPDKDQSFFLWGLDQSMLMRLIFPLGAMSKSDVRAYAHEKGYLRVATKKDSLGICFCPGDYRDFLRRYITEEDYQPGHFLSTQGEVIGSHAGIPFYTVGQRRGLGVQFPYPVFVRELNRSSGDITLAPLSEMYLSSFLVDSVVYQKEEEFFGCELICRIRYRKQATPCRVERTSNESVLRVILLEPLESIAPGQSAVFYLEDRVVGGGLIRGY